MLPPLEESAVEPSELEQQAQRSNRLASKLAADSSEKKQECVSLSTDVCDCFRAKLRVLTGGCGSW